MQSKIWNYQNLGSNAIQSYPSRQISKTCTHPPQSWPLSNIPRKPGAFDKRAPCTIEPTEGSLVRVITGGCVPRVGITFVATEAVCCFPTETWPVRVPNNRKETEENPYRDTLHPLLCFRQAWVQATCCYKSNTAQCLNRSHCCSKTVLPLRQDLLCVEHQQGT